MPTIEQTPLEQALEEHLQDKTLIPVCVVAIKLGQQAFDNEADTDLFDMLLSMPRGEKVTVQQVIKDLHLNQFIDWGGGEV
jgi:hypothetical protein